MKVRGSAAVSPPHYLRGLVLFYSTGNGLGPQSDPDTLPRVDHSLNLATHVITSHPLRRAMAAASSSLPMDCTIVRPIFYYNQPGERGQPLGLHLFEPRYRLMIKRAWSSHRQFVFMPNFVNYQVEHGHVGFVVQLTNCHVEPDGRAMIEGMMCHPVQVIFHWVEANTGELHYCLAQPLTSEPAYVPPDAWTADAGAIVMRPWARLSGENMCVRLRRQLPTGAHAVVRCVAGREANVLRGFSAGCGTLAQVLPPATVLEPWSVAECTAIGLEVPLLYVFDAFCALQPSADRESTEAHALQQYKAWVTDWVYRRGMILLVASGMRCGGNGGGARVRSVDFADPRSSLPGLCEVYGYNRTYLGIARDNLRPKSTHVMFDAVPQGSESCFRAVLMLGDHRPVDAIRASGGTRSAMVQRSCATDMVREALVGMYWSRIRLLLLGHAAAGCLFASLPYDIIVGIVRWLVRWDAPIADTAQQQELLSSIWCDSSNMGLVSPDAPAASASEMVNDE